MFFPSGGNSLGTGWVGGLEERAVSHSAQRRELPKQKVASEGDDPSSSSSRVKSVERAAGGSPKCPQVRARIDSRLLLRRRRRRHRLLLILTPSRGSTSPPLSAPDFKEQRRRNEEEGAKPFRLRRLL